MDVNKVGIAVLVLLILILMAFTPSMSRIGVRVYRDCEERLMKYVSHLPVMKLVKSGC